MRPRVAAGLIMVAWIALSMVLLLLFRGVSLRFRGTLIVGSLVLLIAALGWLTRSRRAK